MKKAKLKEKVSLLEQKLSEERKIFSDYKKEQEDKQINDMLLKLREFGFSIIVDYEYDNMFDTHRITEQKITLTR